MIFMIVIITIIIIALARQSGIQRNYVEMDDVFFFYWQLQPYANYIH